MIEALEVSAKKQTVRNYTYFNYLELWYQYWILNKDKQKRQAAKLSVLKKIKLNVRKVEVTLKQYTKFLILTSENWERKKSHLLRETKNNIWNGWKIMPRNATPLEIFTPLSEKAPL